MAALGSPVVTFLKETYNITGRADDLVLLDDVYRTYSRWCADEGKNALSKTKFVNEVKGSSLAREGVKPTQREAGQWQGERNRTRPRFIQGINL